MSWLLAVLVLLPGLTGVGLLVGGLSSPATRRLAPATAIVASGLTAAAALWAAFERPCVSSRFVAGGDLTLAVDGLSAAMIVMAAVVTLLVLIFAAGEVEESRGRFFGLMLVFESAVLITATATTLPALLLGWEVMGATSYALIAFWWRQPGTVGSGTTAFLTTRLGDLGLYLAAGAALAAGSTLDLRGLADLSTGWRSAAAAGILAAAFGKAAQVPFSFWLSRAMVGPSPVSALLHSAAMVAMGGYLLLRLAPLLAASGWADDVAAWGGALTTVLLGLVAVAQRDLKQLLAASTAAQLGFVVLAAGTAGVAAGSAHLVAHAATKSLLFLAAGAWLAALGTKDLLALRGAARRFPLVGATFAAGALALAGVLPLSLWATKDDVLAGARDRSLPLYLTALAGAVLSAVYAGKALGLVLRPLPADAAASYDTERPGSRHVGALERLPLVLLAGSALSLAVLVLPPFGDAFARLVAPEESRHGLSLVAVAISTLLALAGVTAAAVAPHRLPAPAALRAWLGLEALAHGAVVRPSLRLAGVLARIDDDVLHRGVSALASATIGAAGWSARQDDRRVDGAVRGVARGARRGGDLLRRLQTGQVHQYYAQVAVGLFAALLLLIVVR